MGLATTPSRVQHYHSSAFSAGIDSHRPTQLTTNLWLIGGDCPPHAAPKAPLVQTVAAASHLSTHLLPQAEHLSPRHHSAKHQGLRTELGSHLSPIGVTESNPSPPYVPTTLLHLGLYGRFPCFQHLLLEQSEDLGLLTFGEHSHVPEQLKHPVQQERLQLVLCQLERTDVNFGQVDFPITVIKSEEIPGQAGSKGIH